MKTQRQQLELTQLIDRFLDDRLETKRFQLGRATDYRLALVGSGYLLDHLGYVILPR